MKEIYFVMTWVDKKPHGVSKYVFTTKELAEAHAKELCRQHKNITYKINPLTIIA